MMLTLFTWLLRYIGWPGVLLIAFYIYEEGIPGAHRIPLLTYIPVIGDLTTGRVHTYAAEQVRLADARCKAKTDGMVTRFERDALTAQLNIERKRANDAMLTLEEFRRRHATLVAEQKINREKAEKDIEEDNSNEDGAPRVTGDDLLWLELRHRR